MTRCVVCEKESSRYRCRLCRSAYCSAACSKAHRNLERPDCCVGLQQLQREEEEEEQKDKQVSQFQQQQEEEGQERQQQHQESGTVTHAPCSEGSGVKRTRAAVSSSIYGEKDGDGNLVILGEAHLSALANDVNIRKKLRTEELQRLLRVIVSSRSSIDALEAAMANTPEFLQFCHEVLGVVSTTERNLGVRNL
ncbi:zinc finger family protein [Trypanosoma theileri]|uniref:Zinc finger family protein n=1 Tax=Trypanosoma theileri TaxID=67003 RepID=A0A1X0P3X2_9TRYP|nr:zinc finger family protein [Trypanosoma theileri]ORC91551.1 zinc finger family protein [Trypanosoma theileri]